MVQGCLPTRNPLPENLDCWQAHFFVPPPLLGSCGVKTKDCRSGPEASQSRKEEKDRPKGFCTMVKTRVKWLPEVSVYPPSLHFSILASATLEGCHTRPQCFFLFILTPLHSLKVGRKLFVPCRDPRSPKTEELKSDCISNKDQTTPMACSMPLV